MNTSLEQYHQMNKQNDFRFKGRNQPKSRRFFRRQHNPRTEGQQQLKPSTERRRLIITNLNKELLNVDLKKLFEEFGTLIRCGIHFDIMGNSKGTADIEFDSQESATKAIAKLNQADINGAKINVDYKLVKQPQMNRNRLFRKRFRNNTKQRQRQGQRQRHKQRQGKVQEQRKRQGQSQQQRPKPKRHLIKRIGGHVIRQHNWNKRY